MRLTSIASFVGIVFTCLATASAQFVGPRCNNSFRQPPVIVDLPIYDSFRGPHWFESPICVPPIYPRYQPPIVFTVPVVAPPLFYYPQPSFWQPTRPNVWQPTVNVLPNRNVQMNALAPANADRANIRIPPVNEIQQRVAALKRSTPMGRERADRSVSLGDKAFTEQLYARAAMKYRDAIAKAPDYPEPHFRLAHVYVATRQYNLAVKSVLTALELAGSSRRDGFSLAELYQGNQLARQQHDELLHVASLREPNDGGLQFLIGITMHYGGNPLKGREHFAKANEMPGSQQEYVRHFLPVVAVAEETAQ